MRDEAPQEVLEPESVGNVDHDVHECTFSDPRIYSFESDM